MHSYFILLCALTPAHIVYIKVQPIMLWKRKRKHKLIIYFEVVCNPHDFSIMLLFIKYSVFFKIINFKKPIYFSIKLLIIFHIIHEICILVTA